MTKEDFDSLVRFLSATIIFFNMFFTSKIKFYNSKGSCLCCYYDKSIRSGKKDGILDKKQRILTFSAHVGKVTANYSASIFTVGSREGMTGCQKQYTKL